MSQSLRSINQIVSVGSVDGVLTTAALLHVIGSDVDIVFTQAFTVDKVDPSTWQPGRKVAFVDIAVNNRDKSMTKAFVERLQAAGHQIVAVCDEHDRNDWLEILGTFDGLLIEPQSQALGTLRSSGAVLESALGDELDADGKMLCEAADKADRMEFVGVGALVNQAMKSKIADDTRRVYLARHFSNATEPDATIQGWIKEYEVILANHQEILTAKQDLGDGIIRISAIDKIVDMTTLMSQLYQTGVTVVICEGEMFDKALGRKTRQVAYGTNSKLDLLSCIKQAVPTASGFAQKANVPLEFEEVATTMIRALLRN